MITVTVGEQKTQEELNNWPKLMIGKQAPYIALFYGPKGGVYLTGKWAGEHVEGLNSSSFHEYFGSVTLKNVLP